ncbi:ABC transporter substrate-binding protein [Mariniluteicoccus flavus]
MRARGLFATLVAAVLAVAGCSAGAEKKPIHRPLAVLLPFQFLTSDPAFAADEGSDTVAYHAFQRLMSIQPGGTGPERDAAECKFIDDITYTCVLIPRLQFNNGQKLTTEDVKFSIERAQRVARPGTPGRLLDSIASMEIRSERRIDFTLKHPDNNFAYALASPAASIVSRKEYPADGPRGGFERPVGSGPYVLSYHDLGQVRLDRNPGYQGGMYPFPNQLVLYSASDPAAGRLLSTDRMDALWAVAPPGGKVPAGFATITFEHGESSRLEWNPTSPQRGDAALRAYVRDATAVLRTQTSNRPAPLEPQIGEFPREARPTPPAGTHELTLSHPSADRRAADLAAAVERELEKAASVKVTVRPDARDSDLWVTFDHTPTAGLLMTLQHWTDFPLPGRQERIRELVRAHQRTSRAEDRDATAAALLREAAQDATLLPLTQADLVVPVRDGLTVDDEFKNHAGPNNQLGGWALRW